MDSNSSNKSMSSRSMSRSVRICSVLIQSVHAVGHEVGEHYVQHFGEQALNSGHRTFEDPRALGKKTNVAGNPLALRLREDHDLGRPLTDGVPVESPNPLVEAARVQRQVEIDQHVSLLEVAALLHRPVGDQYYATATGQIVCNSVITEYGRHAREMPENAGLTDRLTRALFKFLRRVGETRTHHDLEPLVDAIANDVDRRRESTVDTSQVQPRIVDSNSDRPSAVGAFGWPLGKESLFSENPRRAAGPANECKTAEMNSGWCLRRSSGAGTVRGTRRHTPGLGR